MIKKIVELKHEIIVIFLFILLRIPSLGHDSFNTDFWRWQARIYDFGTGVFTAKFDMTIQKYHPGVTLMWIGTAAVKSYNLYYRITTKADPPDNSIKTVFELNFIQNLFIVFVIAITLASVFYCLRKLFSLKYAWVFFILLSLEPFYIALTRVVHLEGLLSTFMLAYFIWLYFYLTDKTNIKSLILSSFFASCALLTKSSSLFLIPFSGLLILMEFILPFKKGKTYIKPAIKAFSVWLIFVLLFFVVLWPGMWVVPAKALGEYFTGIFTVGVEGGHTQLYFGKLVGDPGYSFYFVVLLYRTSLYLIVGILGAILYLKNFDNKIKKFISFALLFSVLYFVEITLPTKKLDRYILPSIVGLSLIVAAFYEWVIRMGNIRLKIISLSLFVFHLITIILIHPDYFSYYSLLGGGLKTGIKVLEPKWMVGQNNLAIYFKDILKQGKYETFTGNESFYNLKRAKYRSKLSVAFPEKYYTQMWPFVKEIGGWAILEGLRPEAEKTNFFVYPVWDDYSYKEDRFKIHFVDSVKLRGVPVYNVYERLE